MNASPEECITQLQKTVLELSQVTSMLMGETAALEVAIFGILMTGSCSENAARSISQQLEHGYALQLGSEVSSQYLASYEATAARLQSAIQTALTSAAASPPLFDPRTAA